MTKSFLPFLLFLVLIGFTQTVSAQNSDWWQAIGNQAPGLLRNQQVNIEARNGFYFKTDLSVLQRLVQVKKDGVFSLEIPDPKGKKWTFLLEDYEMMEAPLQAKYPAIRTYQGYAKGQPTYRIHLTITADAWFASISNGSQRWFVDPFARPNDALYQVYYQEDCLEDNLMSCQVEAARTPAEEMTQLRATNEKIEGTLRTFRLAVSASYSYYDFFNSSREQTMAAIISTVNRVNMVFERDLAIRLVLVANNDSLIVTDANSELFSRSSLAGEDNQGFTDDIIGSENYDIGHVFIGNGGGGAVDLLGSVCNNNFKARGYVGLPRPQGDVFDIDYVAHEIGHQFGANHTFNGLDGGCFSQRTLRTSFEPGAGTTIMSYAGICGLDNITPNTNDYFHGGSIVEMNQFLTGQNRQVCLEGISLQNQAPQIVLEQDLLFIPTLTPFELSAKVTDPENDQLTYNWEQIDAGNGASLGTYGSGNGPLFRSYPPGNTPTRVFPRLEDLLANDFQKPELLPNASRELNFQLTVRDNHPNGGGLTWDRVTYFVDGAAGPFRLDNPGTLIAGSNTVFRWDVANTNIAPVNVDSVDLYLSTDGGLNFDQPLGRFVNDGFAVALIPNDIATDSARFKLKAVDNIFFDVSDLNNQIRPASPGDAFISLIEIEERMTFCAQDSIVLPFYYNFFSPSDSIQIGIAANIQGFNGVIETVENNRFNLILTGGDQLGSDIYPVELAVNLGQESADTVTFTIDLIGTNTLLESNPTMPINGTDDITIQPIFAWEGDLLADFYQLELSQDPLFQNVEYTSPFIDGLEWQLPNALEPQTNYFWRITAINQSCDIRTTSPLQQFTTENIICRTYMATDLPVEFNSFPFIQSSIQVAEDAVLVDVNLLNITGTYDRPGGIDFRIRSPEGPVLVLLSRQDDCTDGERFSFSLDDNGQSAIPCPNNQDATVKPEASLRTYNGQNSAGRWTLSIFDNNGNGALESWALELCFGASGVVNTTDVQLAQMTGLDVFPNPVQNQVNFKSSSENIQAIRLLNTAGQVVLSSLNLETPTAIISTVGLVPGIYFYQVVFENGTRQSGKLVK
ncbi:MAG: hypothetical protein Sapg2KO_18210 [Saprospiraceae bacterium]